MIQSIVFSKAVKNISEILEKPYIKVKIQNFQGRYKADFYTEKQSFQKFLTEEEVQDFYQQHSGRTFKNVIMKTDDEEITTMANRHGEIRRLVKKIKNKQETESILSTAPEQKLRLPPDSKNEKITFNRKKNYLIQEGNPVPFLVELGVMTNEGKIVNQRYDKFRQINRFLEFVKDILPDVTKLCAPDQKAFTKERPLYIADFGCGKSYLTFAVYYFLHELENIPVQITGLDLKEDVIRNCQNLADRLGYTELKFKTGDVSQAESYYDHSPDIMITLHACDTATDYALEYAVRNNASAILSVPCCQHEINLQLGKSSGESTSPFASLEHWGILRERFSALATDAIRAELLEQKGYGVQLLEFIDFEGTPKNLLIRAVKKQKTDEKSTHISQNRLESLLKELGCSQTLCKLFK